MSVSSKQKVLCVLYDDPVGGYPSQYARSGIPTLKQYPDGQSLPTPEAIDFNPGALFGSISGELGVSPNPPKDTDGRRGGSGRGWVRELQGRWPGVLG